MIQLPIEIGDVILAGRFKNKKITVKEITFDEYGLPLVNGRGIMKIRIQKLMPTKPNITESITTRDLKPNEQYVYVNQVKYPCIYVGKSNDQVHHVFKYTTQGGSFKLTSKQVERFIERDDNSIKEMVQRIIKEADLTDRPELEKEARRYAELANKMKELEAQLEEMSAEYEGLDTKFRTELEAIGKAKDTFIRAGKILIKIERAQYKRDNKSYKTGWDYLYPRVQGSMKKIADEAMKMVETTSIVKSKIAVVNTENRLVENKFTDLIKKFGGWLKSQTSKLLGLTSQANLELDKLEKLV